MKYFGYLLPVFFVQIGLGIVGPVLPDIKSYFQVNMAATGLVMSSYGLARVIFDLPGGYVAQKLPTAAGMALGIALSVGGALCSAAAPGFSILILGSFIAGMGSAFVNVVILTLLTKETNQSNRGKVLGIHLSFFLAGVSVGPVLGGFLGARWGWRAAFLCSALASLAALAVIAAQILRDRRARQEPGAGRAEPSEADGEQVGGGPRRDMPAVIAVNLVTFVLLFALEGFNNTIIPLYGSLKLGFSPDLLGIILALGVVMRFVVGLGGGMLSDRYGRVKVLIPCLLTAGAGVMVMFFSVNWWVFLLSVLIFSIGRMGNNIPLALLGDMTPPGRIGWMTALNRFIADTGLALGPIVLGTIADRRGFVAAGLFTIAVSWMATLILWFVFRKRGNIIRDCE